MGILPPGFLPVMIPPEDYLPGDFLSLNKKVKKGKMLYIVVLVDFTTQNGIIQ